MDTPDLPRVDRVTSAMERLAIEPNDHDALLRRIDAHEALTVLGYAAEEDGIQITADLHGLGIVES